MKLDNLNPMLTGDCYKLFHHEQYPKLTEYVYSTWTPRTSRLNYTKEVVNFGIQGFIKEHLIVHFNTRFFNRPIADVLKEYRRFFKYALGIENPDVQHIIDLHQLGYLPIRIKSVPEGMKVPVKTPMLTVENTHPKFAWVTNFIETIASTYLWQPATSATIALQYRRILDKYAKLTSDMEDFVQFQGHDFSMRGMGGLDAACTSSAGHLLPFCGTDTVPAIFYLEDYYNANIEKELVGCSVPASEHSCMSAGGKDNEYETYRRFVQDIYPNGIISIVSDTWDLWHVVTETLPKLKDIIMSRNGKTVIRPDSGNPVDIICGTVLRNNKPSDKGVIELLWDIFGGTINSKGYKELDPHIGAIYGDSITVDIAEEMCERLKAKGFSSTNIVLGIGLK